MNYAPNVPSTVQVVELSDDDYLKIQSLTHYFDVAEKRIVPVPDEELEKRQREKENVEPREYLISTDWMILRHMRQKTLGIATSLTDEEFVELERRRNEAAAKIK